MSLPALPDPPMRLRASFIGFRWLLLSTLFLVEILVLSVRFDTRFLSENSSWLARLAGDLPVYLRMAFAALAAALVIIFPRLSRWYRMALDEAERHRWWFWTLLQAVVYAAFFWATVAVFRRAVSAQEPPTVLLLSWGLLGVSVFAGWLLSLTSLRFWRMLLKGERNAIIAAALAGAIAWGFGEIAHQFWRPLATVTFSAVSRLLGLIYREVVYDRVTHDIGTPDFIVQIAAECSGYEGIGLVVVFLSLYLWIFRDGLRFPQSLLLFPLGIVLIWLANVVRITTLIAIGTSVSERVALGGFHSQAGWIAFVAIALALVGLTRRLKLFARVTRDRRGDRAGQIGATEAASEASALLMPLLALMTAVMLGSAMTHGFDWAYPLRPLLTGVAIWRYRRVYADWDWRWTWNAPLIGVGVFVIWMSLEPSGDDRALGDALAGLSPPARFGWLGCRVIGSVLFVPFAEELAFRGYLLRRLVDPAFETVAHGRFTLFALVVSSLAFGLVHGRWFAGTLAGLAFGLAVQRRGKLADAVVAHLTTNALIAFTAVGWGRWSLWT